MGDGIAEWVKGLLGGIVRSPVDGARGGLGAGLGAIRNALSLDTILKGFGLGALLNAVQFLLPNVWLSVGKSIMGEQWEREQRVAMAKPDNTLELMTKNMLLGLGGGAAVNAATGAAQETVSSENIAGAIGGLGVIVGGAILAIGMVTKGGGSSPTAPGPTPGGTGAAPGAARPAGQR